MAVNIAKDVVIRASVENDTAAGVNSVKKSLDSAGKDMRRISEERRRQLFGDGNAPSEALQRRYLQREARARKQAEDAAFGKEGKSEGHFGRLFSDQRTTGLGPVGQAVSRIVGDKLGVGLAIGALAVVGTQIADMTGKLVAFRDQLHKGQDDAASIAVQLGESIPILGQFITAGQNIRELLTGEKQQLEEQKQATQDLVDANNTLFQIKQRTAEADRQNAETLRQLKASAARVPLRGIVGQEFDIREQATAQRNAIDLELAKKKDALANDPELKKLYDAAHRYDARLDQIDQSRTEMSEFQARIEKAKAAAHKTVLDQAKAVKAVTDAAPEAVRLEIQQQDALKRLQASRAAKQQEYDRAVKAGQAQKAVIGHREGAQLNELRNRDVERNSLASAAALEQKRSAERSAQATGETLQGNVYQGQLSQIDAQRASARAAAEQEAQAQRNEAKGNANDLAVIEANLQNKLQAIDITAGTQRQQAAKAFYLDRQRAQFDATQSALDAAAQEGAEVLRVHGEGYEAERVLRQREAQRRKAEIDQQATQAIAQNRDNAKSILAAAAAQKRAVDAQMKESERQANEQQIAGQFGIAKDLVGGRISALQEDAKYGNLAAAVEAKRLQITEQFAERRAQLNKLIRDPDVASAEKDEARRQLGGLDRQESRAQKFAGFTGGSQAPELVQSSRSSGASLRYNEQNSQFILLTQYAKAGADYNRQVAENTKKLADAINAGGGKASPLFKFAPRI